MKNTTKKLIIPVVLALLAVPLSLFAQTTTNPSQGSSNEIVNFFIGNPCYIPVYNTDFNFPPEGGAIIQYGNSYFFVPTYEAACSNSTSGFTVIRSGASSTPVVTPPANPSNGSSNGLVNFFIGNPCYIPVYNTDFNFPPEGGAIIQNGDSLFFVPTYEAACSNSTSGFTVIRSGSSPIVPVTPPPNNGGGSVVNLLTGNPCYIPVYNTDFNFPDEGGAIIQNGSSYFFVPTYLPSCANATGGFTIIRANGSTSPLVTQPPSNGGGSIVTFLTGDPCLVPVYNTDFNFPDEGGHIVQINGEDFFAKTYEPGCENSTSGGIIIR